MDLGPHATFIIAAYMVATAVVLSLIAWVILDYRAQCRLLAELERRGITRKSVARPSAPP
jgi:heme exporter protein D